MNPAIKIKFIKISEEASLKQTEVSKLTGIATSTLAEWKKLSQGKQSDDLRGVANSTTEECIKFVCEKADEYLAQRKKRKKIKVKHLMRWMTKNYRFKMEYFHIEKSRRLITNILIANGKYKEKITNKKYPAYVPKTKKLYPNAQIILDGKEKKIEILGEKFKFNIETLKEIYTDAITAYSISDKEDGAAVKKVIRQHIDVHGKPLAILYDNGSANLSKEVLKELNEEIIPITSYPGHPQTNGIIEGEFGNLERTIGNIKIHGSNKKSIAKQILNLVMSIYTKMKNIIPRCSVCNKLPLKLVNYKPTQEEIENAKVVFQKIKERSEKIRNEKVVPLPEKEQLIKDVMGRNMLKMEDVSLFKSVMMKYDADAIEAAESAFYVYSKRGTFPETKRTARYFCGIVKNKQKEIDLKRKENLKRKKYFIDQKWKLKREEYTRLKKKQEHEKNIRKKPDAELVKWLVNAYNSKLSLNTVPSFFIDKIKRCLAVIAKKTNLKTYINKVRERLMAVLSLTLNQRLMLVQTTEKWIYDCKISGVKSVTLNL